MQRIEDEGHRARLDELVGPIFLRNVQVSVDALGEAIGVRGEPAAQPSPRALADAVSRFSFAVGGYGRALAVDIVEDDEATVERVLAATAPISELRVTRGTGDGEGDLENEDGEPGGPVPSPAPVVTDREEDPSEPGPFTS